MNYTADTNKMCATCARLVRDCKGSTNQVLTGCLDKELIGVFDNIRPLLRLGFPYKFFDNGGIEGNGGYPAKLVDAQTLEDGRILGVYSYPGFNCTYSLEEIKKFPILMQGPPEHI